MIQYLIMYIVYNKVKKLKQIQRKKKVTPPLFKKQSTQVQLINNNTYQKKKN